MSTRQTRSETEKVKIKRVQKKKWRRDVTARAVQARLNKAKVIAEWQQKKIRTKNEENRRKKHEKQAKIEGNASTTG